MMNTKHERRKANRIELASIEGFFRQCDLTTSSEAGDLDITIINISSNGMKVRIHRKEDQCKIKPYKEIFIRGCIFNDRIGFLSSQKAIAIWKKNDLCGIKFTPKLEFDEFSLREMIA
ncbi:hypothetical protein [Maridesulfovibrio hydrothermalis]|uniref:Type IV pilus assembly PilZ n=1 Tax=Maridesulfovibrio hydrothermalis AM13 = DSM 14728 TaxID=1121451 RepID=L0R6P8_9BACT|nr:hypothetical protein [Maridesulfovibrio hydrothermalis]CCO22383.1 Type IV pilus assembly PilZ [Maridesulfovibrio hydrothermalis AM13 = DSM 14728]